MNRPQPRRSAAATGTPLAGFVVWEDRLGARARARGRWTSGAYEPLRFGIRQGWACLFGGPLLGLISDAPVALANRPRVRSGPRPC